MERARAATAKISGPSRTSTLRLRKEEAPDASKEFDRTIE